MDISRNNIYEKISITNEENDGRIWGHVNGMDTMSFACVICKGENYFDIAIASEEYNGIFEFKNVPVPGEYDVSVSMRGYKTGNKTVELTNSFKSIHVYFLLDKSKAINPLMSNIFATSKLLNRILNLI